MTRESDMPVSTRRRRAERLHAYRLWLTENGYSPRTVTLYTQVVRRASDYLNLRGLTLDSATTADLTGFMRTVPATRSSRAGVHYSLRRYYECHGRKDGGPAAELPMPRAPYRLPRPLSVADYEKLLAAGRRLGGIHRVIAELLASTACRSGELRNAEWAQFDLGADPPVWYIDGKGSRRRGAKTRQIPLHPTVADTLRAWRALHPGEEYVFASDRSRDGKLNMSSMREHVRRIADLAGVDDATPHRWRHTVATIALEQTRDLRAVQDFLGHASLQSTQIYTGVLPGRLRNIVDSLPVGG